MASLHTSPFGHLLTETGFNRPEIRREARALAERRARRDETTAAEEFPRALRDIFHNARCAASAAGRRFNRRLEPSFVASQVALYGTTGLGRAV